MNISIAIVEDQPEELETLQTYFDRFAQEQGIRFQLTHFSSAEAFLSTYRPVYDVVLMDIGLPKVNGMDAAAQLRRLDQKVILVFVTNMAQFAVRGYEVEAFDFMVKPITYANFSLRLQRVLNRLSTQQTAEIVITVGDQLLRLPTSQLKYIEISSHDMIYHTTSGAIRAYGNLKEVEASLNPKVFVRCNSCYLVNLQYVRAIKGLTANVDGEELKISRPRRKGFVQALNDYLGGGI